MNETKTFQEGHNQSSQLLQYQIALEKQFFDWRDLFGLLQSRRQKLETTPKNDIQFMTNIGCDVYAHAKLEDPERVMISIGYGFFLDMGLEEAMQHCYTQMERIKQELEKCSL